MYYYNSDEDFAVALKTKEWEDVILARWVEWNSFLNIYDEIKKRGEKYEWKHKFTEDDRLKVPELKFKTLFKIPRLKDDFEFNELLTYAEQAMIESYKPKYNHIAARPTRKENLNPLKKIVMKNAADK